MEEVRRRESVPEFMHSGLGPKLPFLVDLAKDRKFKTYIEIGLYGLHTFLAISKVLGEDALLYGLDLFEPAPREEGAPPTPPISYTEALRVVEEKISQNVYLFKGNSAESLKHIWTSGYRIDSPVLIFIDGGHSHDTVLKDFLLSMEIVTNKRTTIIFDDADWPGVRSAINEGRDFAASKLKTWGFGAIGIEELPYGMYKMELMP